MNMKIRKLLSGVMLTFCLYAGTQEASAQTQGTDVQEITLPALHVSGNQLVDDAGNAVTLHGVMDTPNPFFNRYRWGYSCNRNNVAPAIEYFDKLCTAMSDHEQGSYANLLRLFIDACWINDPNMTAKDERDISVYSETRLRNYLNWLFIPIIENAVKRGVYVSIRPPYGVPLKMKVGDDYQQHLTEVWGIICGNETIKKYAGQLSIELTNEPITIVDKFGNSNSSEITKYFQPVIDKIREVGFTGVIWVPGLGYQSLYQAFVNNPPQDNNYGYAVHVYPGWYNQSDDNADGEAFIRQFEKQVPVVKTHPIFISEVDWSPEKEGEGKYNEFGEWVPANYGTWGTASTSKWGMAYKQMIDHFGNISMTLQGTDLYIDVPAYLKDGTVKPAFDGEWECCAAPCFQWYKEYWEAQNPTGIGAVKTSRQTADGTLYDLQGRKISGNKPSPRLYIQNGKKVFIK